MSLRELQALMAPLRKKTLQSSKSLNNTWTLEDQICKYLKVYLALTTS